MAEQPEKEDSGTQEVPEILTWFDHGHYVDENLKPVAEIFKRAAYGLVSTFGLNEQIYFSLQNLLVAKDAAVRGAKAAIAQYGLTVAKKELWTPNEKETS